MRRKPGRVFRTAVGALAVAAVVLVATAVMSCDDQPAGAAAQSASPPAAPPASSNPLDPPATPPAASNPLDPSQAPAAAWTTYRHPSGGYFEHPAAWRAQVTPYGIALLPPDFDQNAELILAIGQPAGGALDGPGDARVGQYLDAFIAGVAPGMRRVVGEPKPLACRAGKGALYEYEGKLATGQSARARYYTTILGPHVVAIAILANEERMTRRTPDLDRIFASIGQGEPTRDPALVGAWRNTVVRATQGETGKSYFETDTLYTLHPDGRLTVVSSASTSVTAHDHRGEDVGGAAAESAGAKAASWSAADGRLFVLWPDGTATSASYKVFANGVTVTPDGGKEITLERAG